MDTRGLFDMGALGQVLISAVPGPEEPMVSARAACTLLTEVLLLRTLVGHGPGSSSFPGNILLQRNPTRKRKWEQDCQLLRF